MKTRAFENITMKIKTLADLKRIPVGTRLRLVRSIAGTRNVLRIVADVQRDSIAFEGDNIKPGRLSWLNFPKASNFEPTENGFRVYDRISAFGERERRRLVLEYEFEPFTAN